MTLTDEQIDQYADDALAKDNYEFRVAYTLRILADGLEPLSDDLDILHAHANQLRLERELAEKDELLKGYIGKLGAENAEKQATIERLEERGRAFMNAVFLNDGNVVGAGAAFAEVLNDLQNAAKQALQESQE